MEYKSGTFILQDRRKFSLIFNFYSHFMATKLRNDGFYRFNSVSKNFDGLVLADRLRKRTV